MANWDNNNLSWAWSLDTQNNIPEPLDLKITPEIKVDPAWPTPEEQAIFDAQQLAWDQKLIDEWIDPETWLKKVDLAPDLEITPEPEIIPKPEIIPEQKIVPEPKKEVIPTPTPKPIEKVESAQDIKAKEIANKTAEDAQITVEQEKSINDFNTAITSWNLDTARELAISNPSLRWTFNSQVKAFLWDQANIDFFKTYSWMSNEQMFSETKNWNLVVWSEQYKLLPPEQRANFEQYRTQNQAITNVDPKATQKQFDIDNNTTLSLQSLVWDMQKLYSNDLKTKYNELLNSDEINNEAKWLENLQNDISSVDAELEKIEDDVRKEYPTLEESKQNAIIRDRRKNIIREKNSLVNQYNSKLWTYRTLKDNAAQELEFFKWEDQQQKAIYDKSLALYTTERDRMDKWAMIDFEEQSKVRAEERQNSFREKLIEDQRVYDTENKKWVYQTDRDWNLLFIVNWVAEEVKLNDWSVVWITKTEQYTDTVNEMTDWWFEVLRTHSDWKLEYFTRWVNWEDLLNASMWSSSVISQIPNKNLWCGEFTNQYWAKWELVSKTTWKSVWVWDSYDSKKAFVNSNIPQVWWLAVWNPSVWWKFWENGHIWVVTWYNPNDWTIQITDSNSEGNKKRRTYNINASEILNSDWWFVHMNKPWVEEPKYSKWVESWGRQIQRWETSLDKIPASEKWLRTEVVKFIEENDLVLDEDNPIIQGLQSQFDLADEIVDWQEWWTWFFWNDTVNETLIEDISWGFQTNLIDTLTGEKQQMLSKIQFLLDEQPLNKLIQVKAQGATFGALSNAELALLTKSASLLNSAASRDAKTWKLEWFDLSEADTKKHLRILKNMYKKSIEKKTWVKELWLDDINTRLNQEQNVWVDLSNSLDF